MNTKLILAIVIVALVGVVAATYQINNTNDLSNSYTDVEPELQVEDPVVEEADASISGDSANNIITTSSKQQSNTKKSSSKSNSKKQSSITSTANANSRAGSSSASSGSTSSGSAGNGASQSTIDSYSVARSAGIQLGATSTRFISSFNVNGVVYNVYGQYKNGQCIAETEVNTQTGQITGGAWIGEVNPSSPTPASSDDNSNTGNTPASSDNTASDDNDNTTDETN